MDNGLRKALTIGLVSLSFGISLLSPAVADDNKSSDEVSAPTKDELKNSTNRGLHIQPLKPKTTAKSKTLTVTDTKIQKESKVSKSTKTEKAVDVVPKKVVKSAI